MKKTLALILSVLALLIPVSAIELDVAEAAEVLVEETAVLAAGQEPTVPVYDLVYGDLIYFEDFSDNSWGNAYTPGTNAFAMGNEGGTLGTPENGYALASTVTTTFEIADLNITDISSLTLKVDTLKASGSTTSVLPVWGPGNLNDWSSFKISSANESTWTTQVYTFKKAMTLGASKTQIHTRGKNVYFDNIAIYATYDIGNNVRLCENQAFTTVDLTDLETYTFPAPADTSYNAWKATDCNPYIAGQTVNVADVKGKTFVPCYLPKVYDESKGELYWYNDFEHNYVNPLYTTDRFTGTGKVGTGGALSVVANPNGTGNVLKVVPNQSHCGFQLYYDNVVFGSGTYSWNAKIYYPTDDSSANYTYWSRCPDGDGGWISVAAGKWHSRPNQTGTFAADKTIGSFCFFSSSKSKTYYLDDVKLYFKPNVPATQVRLIENEYTPSKFVDISETYTFAAPADTALNGWTSEDGEEYFAGVAYSAAEVGGKTFTASLLPVYAEKPVTTTEDGKLVFFYNGNAADTVNTLGADIIGEGAKGVYDGYHVTYTTDCTALIGSCSAHGMAIAPANGSYAKNGRITLVVEQYSNMTVKPSVRYAALSTVKLGTYTSSWSNFFYVDYQNHYTTYPGNWYTLKANAVTENNLVGFFERDWVSHADLTRGFKSIYVYLDSYKVTIGDTVVDLADYKEYTLPTGTGFNYYKDENGAYYEAGKAYASSTLDGKTLTAVQIDYATKPADFSHGRGILVYFDNGNEADFYSNINANLVGFAKTTDVDGYFTRDLSGNASAGITGTKGVGLDTGDLETKLAYADGTDMKGAIYLVVDMYNNSDSNNEFYRGVRTNSWHLWQGIYTDWRKYTAVSKQWTNIAEAFDSELSFIGFADTDNGNWQGSTFRRVYAYYMPRDRVALDVSGTPEIIDLTGKTEYTFPEITDGVNNVWMDSEGGCYLPGNVAAVEDINTKTYFAANFNAYAPATESDVEMRLSSDSTANGIRFKASIAPAYKKEANEIGFIVANSNTLTALGQDLTFDLSYEGIENPEGKLYVKGVAYEKGVKDIVYGTTDDGADVFSCVCVGMNIENKNHVTTKLVVRPYLKINVSEDDEVVVYGLASSASLAETAQAVKDENGDAYEAFGSYIDTVLATAAE